MREEACISSWGPGFKWHDLTAFYWPKQVRGWKYWPHSYGGGCKEWWSLKNFFFFPSTREVHVRNLKSSEFRDNLYMYVLTSRFWTNTLHWKPRLVNYSPWARLSLLSVAVSEAVSERRHTLYIIYVSFHITAAEFSCNWGWTAPPKSKYLLSGPLQNTVRICFKTVTHHRAVHAFLFVAVLAPRG